jgi:transcriptional regulator with XRE-family HTH domain
MQSIAPTNRLAYGDIEKRLNRRIGRSGMSNILRSQPAHDLHGVLANIAANLRQLRKEKRWSQTVLAERSGISRRMISAIEGGKANISIQSVDQLAEALEVSFARIVRPAATTDNRSIESVIWQGNNGASSGKLLGAALAKSEAEFWLWSLQPGDRYDGTASSMGWQQMVYVLDGVLKVELGERVEKLNRGDFRIFPSPPCFAFVNSGKDLVRFLLSVIH